MKVPEVFTFSTPKKNFKIDKYCQGKYSDSSIPKNVFLEGEYIICKEDYFLSRVKPSEIKNYFCLFLVI